MTFGLSLYTISLLAILVIYFGIELRDLAGGKLLKSNVMNLRLGLSQRDSP